MKSILFAIACLCVLIFSLPIEAAPFGEDEQTELLIHFDGNLKDSVQSERKAEVGRIPYFISGVYGKSVAFLMGDNIITIPEKNLEFSFGPGKEATFECWVNAQKDMISSRVILQKGSGGNYSLTVRDNKICYAHYSLGAWRSYSTSIMLKKNVWTHIAVTHSAEGIIKIYENGILKYRSIEKYPFQLGPEDALHIGGIDGKRLFFGAIDELRISRVVRYDPENKLELGGKAFDVPTSGLSFIENDIMVAFGEIPKEEPAAARPAPKVTAVQPMFSKASLIHISTKPRYGREKDLGKKLLFDGDTITGYNWFSPYAYPILMLIDLGEEKTFRGVNLYVAGGRRYGVPEYRVLAGPSEDELYLLGENYDRLNFPVYTDRSEVYKLATKFSAVKARYLLLDVKQRDYFAGLREIELVESKKDAAADDFHGEKISYDNYYKKEFLGNSRPYPTEDYVTPHIKWAKPLAGGKLKALFLVSHPTCRDIIEVAQRADLDWVMEGTLGNTSSPMNDFVVKQFNKKLDGDWEVLVMGSTRWITIPEKLQAKIIEKIKSGRGLLYIQPRFATDNLNQIISKLTPANNILQGVPIELIQFLDKPADPYILKGNLGKGRVVVMQYENPKETDWWGTPDYVDTWWTASSMLPPIMPPENEPSQSGEYIMAAIIRAMLSAAGRPASVPAIYFDKSDANVVVEIPQVEGIDVKYTAEIAVYDRRMNLIKKAELRGSSKFVMPLTESLPYGANTINCWIKNDKGEITAWGTEVLEIDDTHINTIDIAEKTRKLGEPIMGMLRIKPGKAVVSEVEISVFDNYDRLISNYTASETDKGFTRGFSLTTDGALSQGVKVVAKLYAQGQQTAENEKSLYLLDEKQVYVPLIKELDYDDYILATYGEYPFMILRPYGVHFWKQAGKYGFDLSLAFLCYWPQKSELGRQKQWDIFLKPFVENNMHPLIQYTAEPQYAARPSNKEYLRLAEDSFYDTFTRNIRNTASYAKRWNPAVFSWGDETKYFEDDRPEMLALFREHLKKEHGTLEALNSSWQTKFSSWDEVVPKKRHEVARKGGNIGQYIEFNIFLEDIMLKYYKTAQAAAQEIVPGVRTGLTGTYEPGTLGNDWSKVLKYTDYNVYYFDSGGKRLSREAVRSFGSPRSVFQMATGYDWCDGNEIYARYGAWADLLLGFHGPFYFASSSIRRTGYRNMGIINPDFTITQRGKWFGEEVEEIRAGIGKLLVTSKSLLSPIGVYYSVESINGGGVVKWSSRTSSSAVFGIVNNTFKLLQDMQYKPFFIDRPQLLSGNYPAKMKVLVLPAQFLLSEEEIESMKKFVKEGGALLCMGHPGYMTNRGELYTKYPLADVLGHKPKQGFYKHPARMAKFTVGDCASELVVADAETEFGDDVKIMLKADDGFPLLTKHSYGRGAAYFINGFITEYNGYRPKAFGGKDLDPNGYMEKNARAYRALTNMCFEDYGIGPEFVVSSPNHPEPAMPYFENLRFSNGEVIFNCFIERYIEFLRTNTPSKKLTNSDYRPLDVKLEKKAHVYNVRTKKYLGYTDKITLPVAPCVANVIALSPKKVKGLSVAVDSNDKKEITIQIKLKGLEKIGFSPVAHIEFYSPDGRLVKHYTKNLLLDKITLSAKMTIKHALNDPAGTWEIKATDAMNGKEAKAKYKLK